MALRYGLFDSTEIVRSAGGIPIGNKAQTADFFARYFASFVSSGILEKGGGFALTAGEGLSVIRAPGEAFLEGYFCFDEEAEVIALEPSAVDREYWLVLRLNLNCGEIGFALLVPSQATHLPLRSGGYYDLVLAHFTIPADCVQIEQGMIEDLRGEEACGYVHTLAYSDARRLAESFTLALQGGCEGTVTMDGGEDAVLSVTGIDLSYADRGTLKPEHGGTGGFDAESARINLGAASMDHKTLPSDLLEGALPARVLAAEGLDETARLRNFAILSSLPAAVSQSLADGTLCAVYGEGDRGIYVIVDGEAILIAGV